MKLCSDIFFGATKILALLLSLSAPMSWAIDEAQRVMDKVMTLPKVKAAEGFGASTFIGIGNFYDPLFMRDRGDRVVVNDDGGAVGEKGSRILSFDAEGNINVEIDLKKLPPVVGFDIAPPGFGKVAGQFVVLSQQKSGFDSALENHLVQAIPQDGVGAVTRLCTLQALAKKKGGMKAGFGADGRFGPDDSAFANRFFSVTLKNATVYQTIADGNCEPFITFDPVAWGLPFALNFTQDNQYMLVSVGPGIGPQQNAPKGGIARVNAAGEIVGEIIAPGIGRTSGMAYAPEGFGNYGGQLFVAAIGDMQIPVPMTQALEQDGYVYRIDDSGAVHPVASGFVNPTGIHFAFGKLLVADINGDFIAGRRELPDGFIMAIEAK
ncbi:MAG: hypothetical protein KUG71_03145 [Porticoccaceae bacterium]|nr:hypothetical protein [Porticoccaceae bacterium]